VVIRGGLVVDINGERKADVRVEAGKVAEVGTKLLGDREIDASGCVVSPGLVDMHVHLREPGMEEAETIETGSRAAALGGFTAVIAMPNTEPPQDDPIIISAVKARAQTALCDVYPAGAITKQREGLELAPMGEMHSLGVRIFTDDGACVASAGVMRSALQYARSLPGAIVAQHAEDETLATGHMHEGEWSSRLGIPGRPAEAEEIIVARDCILAAQTGTPVHFLHLSTAGSVAIVRAAKAQGIPVTAEAAPHHFTFTDESCATFDPLFKVNPPLRTKDDVAAVKAGLADGTIDVIASDHAPHPTETKERTFEEASPGMLGLETALALGISELVDAGVMTLTELLALMSWSPARLSGLADHGATIEKGVTANLCVIDPNLEWVLDPANLASRAQNTPMGGRKLKGKNRHTILRGEVVVLDGQATR
jgi:dihydroorotase